MSMETHSLETVLLTLVRSVVREEIRGALAEHRGDPLRNVGAGEAYLSITKAANLADVAPGTIRAWIRAGRLPARRAGRVYRIGRAELETFLSGCAMNAERDPALVSRARGIRRAA